MVPTLFFYELGRIALVGLFLLLCWLGPHAAVQHQPSAPLRPPRRARSPAPKAFAALTTKPPCALCAREAAHVQAPPPVPPAPLPPTHRRPREIDTSQPCCPHAGCDYRGWRGLGHLRANGHPRGGPWRQFHCISCQGYFLETHGTLFHGTQASVELIVRVLACWAEGLGIRATARVFAVAPNTVLQWLVEAAEPLRAFAASLLCDLHLEQLQLDELYAVLRDLKAGEINADEALRRLERSSSWVWTAMDPTRTLLGVVAGGCRTLAMAQRVVPQVSQLWAPGWVPLFLTDGLTPYAPALLAHFGQWLQPARPPAKGPAPKPRCRPLPELRYAQVVKSDRRRRIVAGTHRVVCGTQLALAQVLAACGWTLNTAFIERLNLDIRPRVAAVGRRVHTLCRGEAGLRHQMVWFQTYHNFVLPHAGLRQALLLPEATNANGSAQGWRPWTPAMAAG